MPPRKRKRPSDQPDPSSPHVDTANTANTTLSSSLSLSLSLPDDTTDDPPPPFLNTTFTTHRASPLHLGPHPLTQSRLNTLSQRLRDLLVGDVVRGIELGLGPDQPPDLAMRRAGALELVSLGWVRLETLLGRYIADEDESEADTSASTIGEGGSLGKRRALQIVLQYENTECVALLLPDVGHSLDESESVRDPGSLHLPLLLLRMPAPLRAVICGFLGRTFDCRISALGLGTRSLVGALEGWLGESRVLGGVVKDVVVTLGFYGPTVVTAHPTKHMEANAAAKEDRDPVGENGEEEGESNRAVGIKSIDIIIPHAELRQFVRTGRRYDAAAAAAAAARNPSQQHDENDHDYSARKRRHLGGDKDEEGWTWREQQQHRQQQKQPFMEALAQYLRAHLALDLFHPAVRVIKIACGGFVMSGGRVKIFGVPPRQEADGGRDGLSDARRQRAVWAVYEGLGERARVRPVENTLRVAGGVWDG